jgi:hypothetical protein
MATVGPVGATGPSMCVHARSWEIRCGRMAIDSVVWGQRAPTDLQGTKARALVQACSSDGPHPRAWGVVPGPRAARGSSGSSGSSGRSGAPRCVRADRCGALHLRVPIELTRAASSCSQRQCSTVA